MSSHRRGQRREEVKGSGSGLNLSNIDLSSIAGLLNNIDLSQVTGLINNLSQNVGNNDANASSGNSNNSSEVAMRRSEIAKAVNVLINADRNEVLQVLLQLYAANRTIKK